LDAAGIGGRTFEEASGKLAEFGHIGAVDIGFAPKARAE
jgi:hypothetical protein